MKKAIIIFVLLSLFILSYVSADSGTVEFDGTLSYPLGSEDNYIVVPVQQYKNPSGSTYLYKWEDTATISVGIPSTQTINGQNVTAEGLVAGQYTSNIYLHTTFPTNETI